ncbi:MAG TPA: MarR family transcriptional regulator [Anaerolineales bacterium]|nr:MarR family transcriptional regulator [Anaerolineales bacterium]
MHGHTRSVARKFWIVIPTLMRTVFAESRRGQVNLAPNHFRVLGALARRNCNLTELAEEWNVSLPTMSSTVQTLVERGWLDRDRSSDDRREVTLRMTNEGRRVLASEHRRLTEWVAAKMESLDPRDVRRVERALDILLALFEKSHRGLDESMQQNV